MADIMETEDTGPAEVPQAPVVGHPSGIVPILQYGVVFFGQNEGLYNVRNIVATASLGTRLDLKKIALQARNAEYNPKVG